MSYNNYVKTYDKDCKRINIWTYVIININHAIISRMRWGNSQGWSHKVVRASRNANHSAAKHTSHDKDTGAIINVQKVNTVPAEMLMTYD